MTILAFFVIFSILVFVHEFGHFIVAKKQGLTVHEFGFGFPPRLFSYTWHGTRYSINLLPLGGFVRIKGEEGEDPNDTDSFAHRPLGQRAAVIGAGVFMNALLGWVLFTSGFIIGTPTLLNDTIPEYAIRNPHVVIRSILPHAPATTIDLRVGDTIVAIERTPIQRIDALQKALADRENKETVITITRENQTMDRTLIPAVIPEAKRVGIGVGLDEIGTVRYPFFTALIKGTVFSTMIFRDIFVGFGVLLRDLIVTHRTSLDVSGPIGIAIMTGQVARRGISYLIQFTGLLSLNLAVLNILPIPALDGGRLFFLLIEKIRGKIFHQHIESWLNRIGFVLLILLVILVTYRDIIRLLPS